MSVQELGGQEVPIELVRHILSFLYHVDDGAPAHLISAVPAVCRAWRKVDHDLLREHAALLWSRLPPPHHDLSYARHEKEADQEPTGTVLYAWRHDDQPDGDDEWEEAWTYHQLVAISHAHALPSLKVDALESSANDDDDDEDGQEKEEEEDHNPYYSSMANEYQLDVRQVWHSKPWADLFRRFVRKGCSPQTFGAASAGPVAAVVRLVLLGADGGRPVVIQSRKCVGGHPFIMTDYEDLKLFVTIRPSAEPWLPWTPTPRVLCIHIRDGMMGF